MLATERHVAPSTPVLTREEVARLLQALEEPVALLARLLNDRHATDGGRAAVRWKSYRVIAFENSHQEDYRSSEGVARLARWSHSFSVTAGNKSTVDLDAVPTGELTR